MELVIAAQSRESDGDLIQTQKRMNNRNDRLREEHEDQSKQETETETDGADELKEQNKRRVEVRMNKKGK